ncbi:MAG: Uma2 family endonuclease [Gloeobacterales cyanobacterium]
MVQAIDKKLTLQEFLALPEGDITYELANGEAIAKMSAKSFHSKVTVALCLLLTAWAQERGEIGVEWAVVLKRENQDWVPVPDLLYISYARLPKEPLLDEACPVPPELAIEIISPGQTFGEMAAKATAYLDAGVLRVWIVDTQAKSITVFYPDAPPQTFIGAIPLTDTILEGFILSPEQVFQKAGLVK